MTTFTHDRLCKLAVAWLNGKGGNPILYGKATCIEIPDAIGWCRHWQMRGSVVVECKVSRADFLRDRHKPCKKDGRPTMGEYRYYLAPPDVIELSHIDAYYPDHGLLAPSGRGLRIIRLAPQRPVFNYCDEIEMLRRALENAVGHLIYHGCKVDVHKLTSWGRIGDAIVFPDRPLNVPIVNNADEFQRAEAAT